ncbi:MAG: 2-C-methyl-D-erythritol 2,4-cyclodiphosphate synthase, partial [Pseudomonadota bacterium]
NNGEVATGEGPTRRFHNINCVLTIICEEPKVKPHREAMRQKTAELTGLPIDAVSIKATTTEGLGFTGRREGIAAQATAVLAPLASAE